MALIYAFKCAKDLLEKLKRDAKLLDDDVSSDRFFNFVVTGYSLIDWVKNDPATPVSVQKPVIQCLHNDKWLKVCGDIATASKHFKINERRPITQTVDSNSGWGVGRYGRGAWGVGEEEIEIELNDGTKIACLQFVSEVLRVWHIFFAAHGM